MTIPYGDLPDQVGDLLLPADTSAPFPVVMLIHGGFWRDQYRRDTLAPLAEELLRHGRAVWNVEYRRVGLSGGGYPDTTADVLASFDALPDLPAPLDLGHLVVVGHSAGGHLALWLAAHRRPPAVVSLAGVADLVAAQRDELGAGAVREFLRGADANDHPGVDPVRALPTGVRTLLVHGDADENVPIDQSLRYLDAAVAVGDPCDLLRLPGADHFDIIDPGSDAWSQAWRRWPTP